jgi:hypothetical protein
MIPFRFAYVSRPFFVRSFRAIRCLADRFLVRVSQILRQISTGPKGEIAPDRSIAQWPERPESSAEPSLSLLG